jgi:sugar O-acyltransferase (sialic acid O-acetyltransferase NeuD family)
MEDILQDKLLKMKDIIIIGAGGHGAEIDEYIIYSRKKCNDKSLRVIGFLDDNPANYSRYKFSAPLLGGVKNHIVRKDCQYIMGIANLQFRKMFVEKFISEGADFKTFIHCSAYVSESAQIGKGVVIAPNANVGPNVRIGDLTFLNSRCSMGHDTVVGKYNFISPNVCFSGFTNIGDENLFGINSATIPGIKVGNRNKIAAGMILDKNVEDDSVVFYRYKEKLIAVSK